MRTTAARIVWALALLSLALTAAPLPAGAASFIVSTSADSVAADGATSLREAIATASTNGTDDVIILDGTLTYTLTDCGAGALEYFDTADLLIQGNGATIEQTCAGESIVVKSGPNDNVLTLENINLVVGPNGGGNMFGHAIEATSQLILDQVIIDSGDAGFGGTMVDIDFGPAEFDLIVRDSLITNNTGSGTGNGNPVGVLVEGSSISGNSGSGVGVSDGTPINVVDSTIDDNGGVGIVTSGQGFGIQPRVTIVGSSVSGNDNGGLFCLSSCRTLTVTDSQIDDNGASPTPGRGGGVSIPFVLDGGDPAFVTITGSSISNNVADHPGAGVFVYPSFESSADEQPVVTITDSVVDGNETTCANCNGGGISISVGNLNVAGTSVSDNTSTGNGGGVAFERSDTATVLAPSVVEITGSAIAGNDSGGDGGGLWIQSDSSAVEASTIADNIAGESGGGLSLGGVVNDDVVVAGVAEISGSTIIGNAAASGGGVWVAAPDGSRVALGQSTVDSNVGTISGGGFFVSPTSLLDLDYVTVTRNESVAGANIASNGPTTIDHSVVAEPVVGQNCDSIIPVAPVFVMPNILSQGTNWFDDATCEPVAGDTIAIAMSPELGELADNGGGTLTRLPGEGSPLAGLIASTTCMGGDDQRGVSRPAGFGCEPGAIEVANAVPEPPSGFPASRTPGGDLRINGTNESEGFVVDAFPDYALVTYDADLDDPGNIIVVAPIAGPFRDVRADLRGGDDSIDINGISTSRDLRVDGDAGNDSIRLVDVEVGRDSRLIGGTGEDDVDVVIAQVERQLLISAGNSADNVAVFDSNVGSLTINSGAGSDQIQFSGGVVDGRSTISMGSGDDGLVLAELNLLDDVTITGGSGGDSFNLFASSVGEQLRFSGNGGDDTVSLFNSSFNDRSFFNGGGGVDTYLTDAATSFAIPPSVIAFE